MASTNKTEYEANGNNAKALFTLKIHRGDGMLLLAMNWKAGKPPKDFVGFSIEYKEPNGAKFYSINNRLSFPDDKGKVTNKKTSSLLAPIQMFRWVHFPRNADMDGEFTYKVKPVFMNDKDELSYGESQQAPIQLMRETHRNKLNVAYTRGFVSSQAFVDRYEKNGGIKKLIPQKGDDELKFKPTHPKANEALEWMGFEARSVIFELLDKAIADKKTEVRVIAYDLNLPEIVTRLEKLGKRLKIIIDDSKGHNETDSAETKAEKRLKTSSKGNVKRHHMNTLQHNKIILVYGSNINSAICGSTNFSWRGLYIQNNNAIVINGAKAVKPFIEAFDNFWKYDKAKDFGKTTSALWNDLSLSGIDAKISFSPHIANNVLLSKIAEDLEKHTTSNLFYSLAFLYQTEGPIKDAISKLTKSDKLFIYGISDKKVGGLELQKPNGNIEPVYPSEITKDLPEPFKSEPKGGSGVRMHNKIIVVDFNRPTARVYMGSYNFSSTADKSNGENLLLIKDRKIAVSYMIEALTIFDHYHFRIAQKEAKTAKKQLALSKPPRKENEKPWWDKYYTEKIKIRDRELFA